MRRRAARPLALVCVRVTRAGDGSLVVGTGSASGGASARMPPRCRAGVRDAATSCPTTPRARRARGHLHLRRGSGGRGADGRE